MKAARVLHGLNKFTKTVPNSTRSLNCFINAPRRTFMATSQLYAPVIIPSENADPAMKSYKYWNREEYARKGRYDYLIKISPESIVKEAKILNLSDPNDDANQALFTKNLPFGSSVLQTGTKLSDFDDVRDQEPNVVFVSPSCPKAR